MTDRTSLGDRMKRYEHVPRIALTPRMPMIVRVDGRAFHTYTRRNFKAHQKGPWSEHMRDCMNAVGMGLMGEVSGSKLAYIQSDEVSLLVTDFDSLSTQPWFDKSVQKVVSISASIATQSFNSMVRAYDWALPNAHFDARCFVLPEAEVANYFVWRQQDATRNSIQMLAQANFSAKQLHRKNTGEMQDMLMVQKGINWNDCDVWQKRGWCVRREPIMRGGEMRTGLVPDWEIPIFTKDREYIEGLMRFEDNDDA